MKVLSADFVISNTDPKRCPPPEKPEFAFIGRSNVGKSSLINMLCMRKELARTSAKPGKTQTINHYLINGEWYLVDLPGYGYAGVSREARKGWGKMIETYLRTRPNLYCTFILIDSRLDPQKIDLEFVQWMGKQGLPISILFTKTDKPKRNELAAATKKFRQALLETWEELPPIFETSAEKKTGRDEVLNFIKTAIEKPA